MNKHTPGPWVAYEYTSPKGRWFIQPLEGGVNINYPLNEANARLIAAAPDLLDAAQCAEIKLARYRVAHGDQWIGGIAAEYDATVKNLRAAIAKATQP